MLGAPQKETARRLLEHARSRLKEHQWTALRLWLTSQPFSRIQAELDCTEDEARKLVRSSLAQLRREFSRD